MSSLSGCTSQNTSTEKREFVGILDDYIIVEGYSYIHIYLDNGTQHFSITLDSFSANNNVIHTPANLIYTIKHNIGNKVRFLVDGNILTFFEILDS